MNEPENKQDQINNTPVNEQPNNNVNPNNTTVINVSDNNANNNANNNVEVLNTNNQQPQVINASAQPQNNVEQPKQTVIQPPNQRPTLNNGKKEEKKEEVVEPVQSEPLTFKKKVQYFFVGIFFIILAVFIYFLPEINEYLSTEGFNKKEKVIETGTLYCELEKEDGKITYQTTDEFEFSKELLKSYKRTAKVSTNEQNDTISSAQQECENLEEQTQGLSGIKVSCNSNSTFQRTVQTIDYESVNTDKAKAAFAEVGGTYPQYKLDQKISEIETSMKESGFECRRQAK